MQTAGDQSNHKQFFGAAPSLQPISLSNHSSAGQGIHIFA